VTAGPGANKLLKKIFGKGDYDVNSIPVNHDNRSMTVGIQFELNRIVDLVGVFFTFELLLIHILNASYSSRS
jgi:hypothetical protein